MRSFLHLLEEQEMETSLCFGAWLRVSQKLSSQQVIKLIKSAQMSLFSIITLIVQSLCIKIVLKSGPMMVKQRNSAIITVLQASLRDLLHVCLLIQLMNMPTAALDQVTSSRFHSVKASIVGQDLLIKKSRDCSTSITRIMVCKNFTLFLLCSLL